MQASAMSTFDDNLAFSPAFLEERALCDVLCHDWDGRVINVGRVNVGQLRAPRWCRWVPTPMPITFGGG